MRPIKLVLDTNIVLDWLVFKCAGMRLLQQGIQDKRLTVMTHPPALEEFRRVLTYPRFKLDASRQKEVLDVYQSQVTVGVLPAGFSPENLLLPANFPRCRDRDDEHFLALAHHATADALVSKDKAVLKLRKRAGKFGLKILNEAQLIEALS